MPNQRYRLSGDQAASFLAICHIPEGTDFHALSTYQVEGLIEQANMLKYRKPKKANGSRARSFYAYLRRAAGRKDRD